MDRPCEREHDGPSIVFRECGINPYIWCAVGACVGWFSGLFMKSDGRIVMIENVLVGVFGAFIGGDFVVAMITKGPVSDNVFSVRSLAFAVAGAAVMLLVLRLLRSKVGPMRAAKAKPRR